MRAPAVTFELVPDARPVSDFRALNNGDVWTFHPLTIAAETWIADTYPSAPLIDGGGVGVPAPLALWFGEQIQAAGLTL